MQHDLSGRVRGMANSLGFSIPSPFAWFDAEFLDLNDNDPVTVWLDRSGNGLDALAANATPPIFKMNVSPSGKPVVRFTGTNPLQTPVFPAITQPNTIFIAWDSNQAGRVLDGENDGSRHIIDTSSTAVRIFAGSFLNYARPVNFPRILIHTAIYDGVNSEIREDGVLKVSGNVGSLSTTRLTIGAHHNLGQNVFSGDVAEIIVYDRLLSPSEIEQVETYLYRKYFTIRLSGEVSGKSVLDGLLPEEIPIHGSIHGQSSISGALGINKGFTVTVQSQGGPLAQIGRVRQLFGQLEGISMLGADLEPKKALFGFVEATSQMDARLRLLEALFGLIQGKGIVLVRVSEDIVSIVELDGIFQLEIELRGEVKTDGS